MRGLLCLGIYALIAKETRCSPLKASIGSSEHPRSCSRIKEWQDGTRKFFIGDKAAKTASLTVLRVIQFCCDSSGISTEQALEGMELCANVIKAIDPIILDQWAKENASLVKKLQVRLNSGKMEKELQIAVCTLPNETLASDLDPEYSIRRIAAGRPAYCASLSLPANETNSSQVLDIYVSLVCLSEWPLSVPTALQAAIPDLSTDSRQFNVLSKRKEKVLSSVLDSVWRSSEHLDECLSLVDCFLYFAIDRCQPRRPVNPQLFLDMGFASITIATIRQNVTKGSALPTRTVEYATTQGLPEWWNVNVFGWKSYGEASDDCSGSQCCHHEAEKLRLRLAASISSLFVEAALKPSSCPLHHRIPPAMLSSLLQQLTKPGLGQSSPCRADGGVLRRKAAPSLARGLVSVDHGSQNWRQSLAIELQTVAMDSHELIIGHVNSICRDLEHRCNIVEMPLREALEKIEAMQNNLDSTNAELTASSRENLVLEGNLRQARDDLDAETEQKIQLLGRLDAAVAREDILSQALTDCKKTVSDTKAEAAAEVEAVQECTRMAADAMQADQRAKVEQLHRELTAETEKISTLESDNQWMRDHVDVLQEDLHQAQALKTGLERQLHQQAETLSDVQRLVSQLFEMRRTTLCGFLHISLIRVFTVPLWDPYPSRLR